MEHSHKIDISGSHRMRTKGKGNKENEPIYLLSSYLRANFVVVSRRFESDKIKKKIKIQANKSGTEI
jgi:hypothetical protein